MLRNEKKNMAWLNGKSGYYVCICKCLHMVRLFVILSTLTYAHFV